MTIDLARLREMHPLLPLTTALGYTQRVALGLGRHGHSSGVTIKISLKKYEQKGILIWENMDSSDAEQIDFHRITEDAAEAIALALVKVSNNWTVRRRLQRGESADWLLLDSDQHTVALEVSGVNGTDPNGARCNRSDPLDWQAPRATPGIAVPLFAKTAKRGNKGAPLKTFSLREKVYCEGGRKNKNKVKSKVKNKTLEALPPNLHWGENLPPDPRNS